jgi:SAM-dependent methyltransferase
MNCRHCATSLTHQFLDLGHAPPSNAYLKPSDLIRPELHYPLKVMVCDRCWLVQTEDYADEGDLFSSEYAYFSSTSKGWLAHAAAYASTITERLNLTQSSFVIEVASNDGYLLKNFVHAGIPCLGIEPTASTASAAEALGIPVIREFFGESLGRRLAVQGKQADLIAGNNVYAHVPDINNFTRGLKAVLKPGGTITLEFPHLMRLIQNRQFDTIYHEHFSYLSLLAVSSIFAKAGLRIHDVEELETHGGSLRIYGSHADDARPVARILQAIRNSEFEFGLAQLPTYQSFQAHADRIKDDLVQFLIISKREGKRVAAYGAAAKGNTLLNYGGVRPDLLEFVCDAAAAKQGKHMPGSHIPILAPAAIAEHKPDYVLILPWNIAQEVQTQLEFIRDWNGRFVTAVPQLHIV